MRPARSTGDGGPSLCVTRCSGPVWIGGRPQSWRCTALCGRRSRQGRSGSAVRARVADTDRRQESSSLRNLKADGRPTQYPHELDHAGEIVLVKPAQYLMPQASMSAFASTAEERTCRCRRPWRRGRSASCARQAAELLSTGRDKKVPSRPGARSDRANEGWIMVHIGPRPFRRVGTTG